MDLRNTLLENSSFTFENKIFYQYGISPSNEFEKNYLTLREKEGRVYSDEIVQKLPDFPNSLLRKEEWKARRITMMKLIHYLNKRKSNGPILELGCGNGWLAHHLAVSSNNEVCGMDINEQELHQGARLFIDCKNLIWVYGNIFTAEIKAQTFDTIVLSSSIQYFSNVKQLMKRLLELLRPSGEIHVVDSPLYENHKKAQKARKRSFVYFKSHDMPGLTDSYFHHTLLDLKDFSHKVLFDPRSSLSILKRKVLKIPQMVFPWILIKQN